MTMSPKVKIEDNIGYYKPKLNNGEFLVCFQ